MSNFSSKIEIFAGNRTKAIFRSIEIDNMSYEENQTKTKFLLDKKINIHFEADDLSNIRANLNSILRLVQTSNESIESVKI